MKKCMNCGAITQDENTKVCVECGGTRFAVRKKKTRENRETQQREQEVTSNRFKEIANDGELNVIDWVFILVQLAIPIWNIVFIIKTLVGKYEPQVKKNFIKAVIIMTIISIVLTVVFSAAIMSFIVDMVISTF